jgi:hypothetical protein
VESRNPGNFCIFFVLKNSSLPCLNSSIIPPLKTFTPDRFVPGHPPRTMSFSHSILWRLQRRFPEGHALLAPSPVAVRVDSPGAGLLGASGNMTSLVDMGLELDATSQTATITLTGPSRVWFGVGFNASGEKEATSSSKLLPNLFLSSCLAPSSAAVMADSPWAVIVTGADVQERKLANHAPGAALPPSLTVVSNTVLQSKGKKRKKKHLQKKVYIFKHLKKKVCIFLCLRGSLRL